jgi:hypothetical protein
MTNKTPKIKLHYTRFLSYKKIANSFFEAANISTELGYYNAAGVHFVHSAIAFGDAITIKLSSIKSSGENHFQIISLIEDVVKESNEKSKAITHLRKIIDQKNLVSYSGEEYNYKDIAQLQNNAQRFQTWALKILDN